MNVEEFLAKPAQPIVTEPGVTESAATEPVEAPAAEVNPVELDIQKAVVEALAADKVEMDEKIAAKDAEVLRAKAETEKARTEIAALKAEIDRLESRLAAVQVRELDLQERNPNALALLDRDVDIPDRFPGETRDHVLEVIKEARDKAEADGRLRRAQILEGVLLANEPNGNLAKKRAELEKLFIENANVLTGPVLEELKKRTISHKNGEEYLLPSEIMARTY
jgi:chromosome segregation ATPase